MKQHNHIARQFADASPRKQARRERFMRKVAGRQRHLRMSMSKMRHLRPTGAQ